MNNSISLAPLFRHTVGFDRFDELFNSALRADQGNGYPPYDIVRQGENTYQVIMAVAGFSERDLNITVKEHELRIAGRVESTGDNEDRTWLHRGIARRAFERSFRIADHVQVEGARLRDGLLFVDLKRVIPEEARPRMVEITRDHDGLD